MLDKYEKAIRSMTDIERRKLLYGGFTFRDPTCLRCHHPEHDGACGAVVETDWNSFRIMETPCGCSERRR